MAMIVSIVLKTIKLDSQKEVALNHYLLTKKAVTCLQASCRYFAARKAFQMSYDIVHRDYSDFIKRLINKSPMFEERMEKLKTNRKSYTVDKNKEYMPNSAESTNL